MDLLGTSFSTSYEKRLPDECQTTKIAHKRLKKSTSKASEPSSALDKPVDFIKQLPSELGLKIFSFLQNQDFFSGMFGQPNMG